VDELSDSIAWPSRDPEWVTKVLLIGLISLIPIVGQMNLYGWMLSALDNLRAGRPRLPPAGFQHISRGVNLFVVWLVYGLVLGAVISVLFVLGFGVTLGSDGRGSAIGIPLVLLAYALLILGMLAFYLVTPVIVVATERGGIGGGLNVPSVIDMIRRDVNIALNHGLFALVAYLISGIGAILCFIGQIFTQPYGFAVLAGIVHHYERAIEPPAALVG
jgi:Protein of unknown function (DUF4013)